MDSLFLFAFTIIASTEGFLVSCALILVGLLARKRALPFLVATIGVLLSTVALKELLQVARPVSSLIETTGYAFPSGHATGSLFLALSLCYLPRTLPKPLRFGVYVAALMTALVIGLSRLHFGVHTPLQVFAGYLLGAVWAGVYIWMDRRFTARQ